MSELRQAVEDYLRIRRALGYKLSSASGAGAVRCLPGQAGADTITAELALAVGDPRATQAGSVAAAARSWSAGSRGTCRRSTRGRRSRPTGHPAAGAAAARIPYMYSDHEIAALLAAAGDDEPAAARRDVHAR